MRIGYLGPKATFTEAAVAALFPSEPRQPYATIPDCIDAVAAGEIEAAVVPLENALEGSVNLTLDYLIHEQPLPIIGEIVVPIEQHFMVHPYYAPHWREIKEVYSHSHAIAQCRKFLHTVLKGAKQVPTTSTSAAAKFVSEHPHLPVAAIANRLAASEYGLTIVQENIHDYDYNHTRFIVVSRSRQPLSPDSPLYAGDKTTIVVMLPQDQPGALHQVLSAFAWRRLNLTKIESRPAKTGLGNYFFIIDIDAPMDDVLIPGAIAEIEALGCTVQLLGSYPYYFV
ncbi:MULTISPECIES: prephenate dehydratase [Geobacillus]|jgi:prephenate dehydratase|uniref:Prephenate dehydratase n=2 Tax=Geobacillus thermodenitrificans TaxID=33940 RepID=A4IRC5_GEOTN|nr:MULTISPECIES: prephenate dehydratase [Geobacillus]ABO67879.1 Prephenate dehydratase [Geobacillus thermodenitrificans NG80-2]ARA98948.1 prephenate dehydratase [Geobacillus thermodenitrificans]ARP43629.1 Prephenate dehydratase [Geobacillus thermodenitrificans]ATO38315.1 prephenate dehydratase [Geobacillus thermodenitrificans]KQB92447.1 Prephenate dehydratase [Geobacillus sp. PA-3]